MTHNDPKGPRAEGEKTLIQSEVDMLIWKTPMAQSEGFTQWPWPKAGGECECETQKNKLINY